MNSSFARVCLFFLESILWALDQFCGVYVRSDLEKDTIWEQADDSQFGTK